MKFRKFGWATFIAMAKYGRTNFSAKNTTSKISPLKAEL